MGRHAAIKVSLCFQTQATSLGKKITPLNEKVFWISRCRLTNISQRERVLDYVNRDPGYPLIQQAKTAPLRKQSRSITH